MYIYVCTENEFLIMQEEKIHTRRYGNILDILKENKMALIYKTNLDKPKHPQCS